MDGKITCNGRLVSVKHNMAPPLYITYSSVLTREIVRLAFLITDMNNLDICFLKYW